MCKIRYLFFEKELWKSFALSYTYIWQYAGKYICYFYSCTYKSVSNCSQSTEVKPLICRFEKYFAVNS